MKTAVIVTTYNRPDALAAVLDGYQAQSTQSFELLVADDGSTEATRAVVDDFRSRATFPVNHVWHEDRGFRAAAIRNRALAATAADYIIFSDGDCVPAGDFDTVKVHRIIYAGDAGNFRTETRVDETDWFAPSLGLTVRTETNSSWQEPCGRKMCIYRGDWHLHELTEVRKRN